MCIKTGTNMKILIKITTILFLIVILIIVSAGAFIGAGYVLSLLLPLTLFQCSAISVAATFVSAFIITVIIIGEVFIGIMRAKPDAFSYDEEDEEEKEDEEEVRQPFDRKKFTVISNKKIGRNELCPCGSGKKYKYCCGKEEK